MTDKHKQTMILFNTLERLKHQYNKTYDKKLVRHIVYHRQQLRALLHAPGE